LSNDDDDDDDDDGDGDGGVEAWLLPYSPPGGQWRLLT